ncbi:unnamed protein product [Dimorphilus gyrociliatus]|uniref:Uncharacterized protein n=1 Tax=Dimorphilus gyrociliatus TaxID=2664684 RepID=A0A7I8WEE3_9ANNE|nr:unnamed protein product [Dimorphilus gyrociliatus]
MIVHILVYLFLILNKSYSQDSDKFYVSCSQAIIESKQNFGFFQMQFHPNSKTVNISCEMINDTLGTVYLDNDSEEIEELNNDDRYETKYSFKKLITYEGLSDKEVDKFLETVHTCSQGINYWAYGSLKTDHGFLFWDGAEFEAEQFTDGICNCFSTTKCLDELSPTAGFYNDNKLVWTNDSGIFSVKSSRLPLKQIYLGDVGGAAERIKYSIWKLKCTFPLILVKQKFPVDVCGNNKWSVIKQNLFDNDQSTCLTFTANPLHLTIETIRIFSKFIIHGKDFNTQKPTFVVYVNDESQCKESLGKVFECLPTKFVNLQLYLEKSVNYIELCEIQII